MIRMARRPLEGIKVVDFSNFVAAPTCARLLGDMGASVIKVETLEGCPWRKMLPTFFLEDDELHNPVGDMYNANKRGIALDLKTEKGMDAFHRLLADADVLVTNTRAQSLVKLGLDYETLHQKYPRLIYAFLAGYGEKGPRRNDPAYDAVAFWADTGFLADMPKKGEYPLSSPSAMGDVTTGTTLFGGVAAALYNRTITGEGEKVVVSLYGTGIWVNGTLIVTNQPAFGNRYPKERYTSSPTGSPYLCSDGEWLMLAITQHERFAKALFTALGREDLIGDERFDTTAHVAQNRPALIRIYEEAFAQRPADEWVQILGSQGLAVTKLAHMTDVATSEQALANGFMFENTYKGGKKSMVVGCPIQFPGLGPAPYENAPLVGEHTVQVLQELGYTETEIQQMLDEKAAKQHE